MIRRTALLVAVVSLTFSVCAQQPVSKTNLLIEAFQTIRPSGPYRAHSLWARLRNDGTLEWEQPVWGKPNELHSYRVPSVRLAAIAEDLKSVDWSQFAGKLGPYYRYVDTVLELQFRISDTTGEHTFTVINPWAHWKPLKPMPNDLKRTICEVQILRAEVLKDKVFPMCEETLHRLQCVEGIKSCVKP